MFNSSHIELSKSAFKKNIDFLKDYIGRDVAFCSVIKGNAYGHGIEQFVPMAEACGLRHFAVFSAGEARQAFDAKQHSESRIMIMGMIDNGTIDWAIGNGISFYVFEPDRLRAAIARAKEAGKPARIHLQLETGMNRLGLEHEQFDKAASLIRENKHHLAIEGICTHYAGAESVGNYLRITKQIENFNEYVDWFNLQDIRAAYRHTACSAATLNYPETIMDMVRIGIAQYGFWPNRETYMNFVKNHPDIKEAHEDPLNRVVTWKSTVMSTKQVEVGEFVGYGNTYLTSRDQVIASIPVGYAHGFDRSLSNTGHVLIRGERAPVAGLVSMNMLMADVTDIPGVQKGDEVVIIGRQQDQEITVASFSEFSKYLNYEVLVSIPSKLPRMVVE